jgi:predicted  nucleic acid-binding Zn-ribbon protein
LREQLTYLLQLQAIDNKVRELETQRTALPATLEPLRKDLAKLEGMLNAERAKLTEGESWKKQQTNMLESDQAALRAAKAKVQQTKNGKEYNAASREVDHKQKSISDRQTELKKMTDALGSSTTMIGERDQAVQGLRDQLASEEARIATRLGQLDGDIAEASAGRNELRGKIEKEWVKTYDRLVRRGTAVAPVENGTCQGCRVRIPPQVNNILARMESLQTCERCGRIIYRKEMLDPPAPAADAAPAAPAGDAAPADDAAPAGDDAPAA